MRCAVPGLIYMHIVCALAEMRREDDGKREERDAWGRLTAMQYMAVQHCDSVKRGGLIPVCSRQIFKIFVQICLVGMYIHTHQA